MYNQDSVYYADKIDVLGTIGKLDFLEDTMTLVDEDSNLHEVDMKDVIELRAIGQLKDGTHIYEHDVLYSEERNMYCEIELVDDDKAVLVKLNDSYVPTGHKGLPFEKENIASIGGVLIGNVFQLRKELPKVNFNIAIYRKNLNGETTYYYVGNNKEEETVDLIKVIYIGSTLLEEESYKRVTLTYKQFSDMVLKGHLKKVDPQELSNYVAGKTYGESYAKPKHATTATESASYGYGKCDCYLDNVNCNGDCMKEEDDDESLWN